MRNLFINILVAILSSSITIIAYQRSVNDNCISFKKEEIKLIPFKQYFENASRFKNMIADNVTADLANLDLGYEVEASLQCTFPLNTLKNFIYKIDSVGQANDDIPYDSMSITMHYAVYPNTIYDLQRHKEYTNLQTLYLTPSFYSKRGVVPLIIKENAVGPFVTDSIEFYLNENVFLLNTNSFGGDNQFVQNQGQLCPPDCSGLSNDLISRMNSSASYDQ